MASTITSRGAPGASGAGAAGWPQAAAGKQASSSAGTQVRMRIPLLIPASSQLRPKTFVDHLRIGLAGHRLHHLADEKAEQGFLARLVLLDLVGVGGEHLVDHRVDRAAVGGLLEAPCLDDLGRALATLEHDL